MNIQKSTARIKENKKRTVFFLKVFLFLLMIIVFEFIPDFKNVLIESRGLYSLYKAAIFLLGGNILISLARIITAWIYLRKSKDERIHGNFLLGITWISNILNVVVFIISLMLAFDIRPLEFLTSLTIVAAAIAILSKDYVTNMINGLIIMFTDQFSLGDSIKIGEQKGIIEDINLLNLVLRNEEADKVIIPNTLILTSLVTNHHPGSQQKLTFNFELSLNQKLDINELENRIRKELLSSDKNFNSDSFKLELVSVEKDFIKLRALARTEKQNPNIMNDALKRAVIHSFNEDK